jgi:hypothetical protein
MHEDTYIAVCVQYEDTHTSELGHCSKRTHSQQCADTDIVV